MKIALNWPENIGVIRLFYDSVNEKNVTFWCCVNFEVAFVVYDLG